MIWAFDSSFDAPSLAQAQAAKAAGIGFWWGYLATRAGVGLAAPWPRMAFWNVQQAGLGCGAMVSGWDDPVALRQLADSWGIPLLALDDEDGIRRLSTPDWRPAFLAAAGAGHYGLQERLTIRAPFRIAALYPRGGCTGATWPTSTPPAGPHGWQCQGTHTELGLSVDRSALDDWFRGDGMTTDEQRAFVRLVYIAAGDREPESEQALEGALADLQSKGAETFVTDYVDAGEFQARMAALAQLVADYRAGKLGGAPASDLPKVADALDAAAAQLRG